MPSGAPKQPVPFDGYMTRLQWLERELRWLDQRLARMLDEPERLRAVWFYEERPNPNAAVMR